MNCERWMPKNVFVYRHPVDMRKQIHGLATIVSAHLDRDPADESLYVFINKGRDKIKLLIWHRNGFWLLYKRLEKQRFHWPDWFNSDVELTRFSGHRGHAAAAADWLFRLN